MLSGRTLLVGIVLSTVAGCAQPGPIRSHFNAVGSLKANVSQLEFQNESLKKSLAESESKNRELGDKLVQEESARDALASKYDDARTALRKNGLDFGDDSQTAERDDSSGARTLPAGRSSRTKRKPPFAQIPGRIETLNPSDSFEEDPDAEFEKPRKSQRLDLGPQSRTDTDGQWLPVARSSKDAANSTR
jgi:hypothetical protein